ncbi:MAG TPA: hypothetical protein ENN06_06345 [Desulfobacteraceae bacterium]|nr:hypothetical protein [Desulfobacteraceae bacterium]
MKQCSLHNFTESLRPWLDNEYIRSVAIDRNGLVTFTFVDGIRDTYEITDCDRQQVRKVCAELAARGIPVQEI